MWRTMGTDHATSILIFNALTLVWAIPALGFCVRACVLLATVDRTRTNPVLMAYCAVLPADLLLVLTYICGSLRGLVFAKVPASSLRE